MVGRWCERHGLDGPALVAAEGRQEWWVDGYRHRLDGPAIIWSAGDCMWYLCGKLHCTTGSAIVETNVPLAASINSHSRADLFGFTLLMVNITTNISGLLQ